MAVDSRAKRSSALMLAPWAATLPPADSGLNQADRQHVAFTYRGILAAALQVISTFPDPTQGRYDIGGPDPKQGRWERGGPDPSQGRWTR